MYSQGYRPPRQEPQGKWYAPPPQQKRKRSAKPAPKPRPKRSLKGQLIKLAIVLLVVACGCGGLYVWKTKGEIAPYQNVFLDNVSVDGIDLTGKTYAEGSQLVWDHVNQKKNSWYVRLSNAYGNSNVITADMLGISFDPTAALEAAWSVGHDTQGKNLFERKAAIEQALSTGHAFSSAEQSADTSYIDSILQQLAASAFRAPQDAAILGFNPDDTANPFTYQQEVYGQQLNVTAIREKILSLVQNLESGDILLETETLYPSVTVADLAKTVELRGRAVTPISKNSSADRTQNIRTAFSRINGMELQNGKKFSFNSAVGRRTLENGFLPAVEYAYGSEVWGIGGGTCQASTTLYLAAIQSCMTILNREPHSMAVSYTGYGLDATVNDTRGHEIDFTFRNESGGPVYIAAHVITSPTNKKNFLCEVRIYGPSLEGKTYELQAEIVETIPKPVEAVMREDKEHEFVTYVDETKTIKGRDGYKVDAYLVTYQDGTAVDRRKVSTDYYKEKADTVYVGTELREVY